MPSFGRLRKQSRQRVSGVKEGSADDLENTGASVRDRAAPQTLGSASMPELQTVHLAAPVTHRSIPPLPFAGFDEPCSPASPLAVGSRATRGEHPYVSGGGAQ